MFWTARPVSGTCQKLSVPYHYTRVGTWNQPAWKRDAEQEYLDKHIESAVRFNISDISDKQSSAPLMLPPPQQFEEQVGKVYSRVCVCVCVCVLVHNMLGETHCNVMYN